MATIRDLYAMKDRRMGDPDWQIRFMDDINRRSQEYYDRQGKTEKEKLDAYTQLRNAGYSKQQAYKKTLKKVGYDMPERDISDLDTEKKRMDILKTKEDIKDKRLRRITGSVVGYDNPDDIPEFENGLPVKKIEQDRKTGKWYGVYGTTTGNKEDIDKTLIGALKGVNSDLDQPKQTAGESVFGKMLNSIFGGKKQENKIPLKAPLKQAEFSPEKEKMITENMAYFGKTREEVISALKARGLI